MLMRKMAWTKLLIQCKKEAKAIRKQARMLMYLTEIVVGLVSPYVILVKNMLYEELPTHAPIKELKAREVEAKKFAAVIVLEITVRD